MCPEDLPVLISECQGACIWWLESDRALCRLLADRLRGYGWRLELFHHVKMVRSALHQGAPDLLLLDAALPEGNGLVLLRQLRREQQHFPVLILSAMAEPRQRIKALAAGANDVMAKPFFFRELIWRIERLLQAAPARSLPPLAMGVVSVGPLSLDPAHNCLRAAGGAVVPISRGDRALLLPLLRAPGAVLSRAQLARACGSLVDVAASRSLDVRLSRLRRRLRQVSGDRVSIEAVRGRGYRLTLDASEAQELPSLSASSV
jgi:DNA-binding response OmpR family regulator